MGAEIRRKLQVPKVTSELKLKTKRKIEKSKEEIE